MLLKNETGANMQLMTDKEAAEFLRVSRQTVWNWSRRKADFPKPMRLADTTPRWLKSDIEAYVAAQVAE